MLVGIFQSKQKLVSIFVLILVIILWLPSFWNESVLIDTAGVISNFSKSLASHKFLNYFICVALICFQAIYLNHTVNTEKIVQGNTYLTAFSFVLLQGVVAFNQSITPLLISNTIVIVVLHQLFRLYSQPQVYTISFNIGALIGVLSLFYFPLIILFPLLWFTLLYTGTPKWRNFVISITGLILPLIYYVVYLYFTVDFSSIVYSDIVPNTIFIEQRFSYTIYVLLFLGGVALLFFLKSIQFDVVKVRRLKTVLFIMFLILVGVGVFNRMDFYSSYILATVPLAVFIAHLLNELKKKWVAELLILFLVVGMLLDYFS